MNYDKPFLTYQEQILHLATYGIKVRNSDQALESLRRLGYYRISAYWYPFRYRSPEHVEGEDVPESRVIGDFYLEDFVAICDFDSDLRNILLQGLEAIELSTRVAIAYEMGKRGKFSYLETEHWGRGTTNGSSAPETMTQFEAFKKRHHEGVSRSKEDFVKHFLRRYDGNIPIWVVIELWEFGTMSRFFQIMHDSDRAAVAASFGVPVVKVFNGWLSALNDLRNFCAHHQRLNRRHFPSAPAMLKVNSLFDHARLSGSKQSNADGTATHRLYPLMVVMAYLTRESAVGHHWRERLIAHISKIQSIKGMAMKDYAIPESWSTEEIWRN